MTPQEWLQQNYPNKETYKIYINQQLEGTLDCSEYKNLEWIYISSSVDKNKFEIKKGSYGRERYSTKIISCIPAQDYLDQNYPIKERRTEITQLDISNGSLEGNLDLSDFENLEELNCHNNYLTSLKINDCRNLKVIYCSLNRFTTLELSNLVELKKLISFNGHLTQIPILPNPEKITELVIRNNNIKPSDLTIFSQFKNLENLRIGNDDKNRIQQGIYNRFHDSLEPLKNLNKLKSLDISNTDIESGLEYLPDSINSFYCSTTVKRDAKCKTIYNLFANDQGEVEIYEICGKIHIKNLSQKLKEYKQKIIKQKAGEVLKDEFQALEDKHQKELQLEREELEKALQASQKWHERKVKEITDQKDKQIQQLIEENKRLKGLLDIQAQTEVPPK